MSFNLRTILVLCEGNHCRSPMAEALLKQALGPDFKVSSAGLRALENHPAHQDAQRLMSQMGLDISNHRGRQLTPDLALDSELIFVMDEAQKEACERAIPSLRGRVYLLGHWLPPADRQILDPIQRGTQAHQIALEHIQRALPLWVSRLGAALE